jgi:sugar phosphate isomerase/epimerase
VRLGISTGALIDKADFASLLDFEPEVIEFYNYPSRDLEKIAAFCGCHSIEIGLHVPTPYDGSVPLTRFAPTGGSEIETAQAIGLTKGTIRTAAALGSIHVVVHFPSPYKDTAGPVTQDDISRFFDPVVDEAVRSNVLLLVENLSTHPTFNGPNDYGSLLERYSALGMCLDFGHACQLALELPIASFCAALGPRIRSCHVYNQRLPDTSHVPVHSEQRQQDGWIDIPRALRELSVRAAPTLILEPSPLANDARRHAVEGAGWLRTLLKVQPEARRLVRL